ncbi:MAG: excinuclease ATPase subunit [Pseudomonadota bacterium]
MKKIVNVLIAGVLVAAATAPVQAADNKLMMPLAEALANDEVKSRLGDSVKFYFGSQPTPKVLEQLASDKTSLRTNSFGKSNEAACTRVFLSALLSLQKRANALGANAVINIVSNFKNVEYASTTDFECHAGSIMAGVALKGDFVKIADK